MIMNMLTGAHASLIPLITTLHDEASTDEHDVSMIIAKLNAVLSYDAESWVHNMSIDMVIDFFEKLPRDIRFEVAQSIDLHDGLPLRFCLYLMDQNSQIAENMIENTDLLDTHDLIYRIHCGQVREMIAVAKRKNLSLEVMNALVDSREPQVYMELLNNPCVQVQADVIKHLSDVTKRSAKMAWYFVNHQALDNKIYAAR